MTGVAYPKGWSIELLGKSHQRRGFDSGQPLVDDWLRKNAWQSQAKHLTATKVLLNDHSQLVGYYTLATSQIDFSDLPMEVARKLPKRRLPVAVIAWLGIDSRYQGRGLGKRLLATALSDCHDASKTFPFVAVLLDCVDEPSRKFYERFDFEEVPGYPSKMFLSFKLLEKLITG